LNAIQFLISFACAGLITGCAANHPPPAELDDARQAYARASACPAAKLVPENMYKAREALARAEQSFRDNPKSQKTRVLANIAYREAKLAGESGPISPDSTVDRTMGQRIPVGGN
jgi:Domain of unknown function (DUF4398)